jgi:septal ring factor EnvC (AmiA/AmiB activator)
LISRSGTWRVINAVFIFLLIQPTFGQSRKELEERRKDLLKNIEQTTKALQQTREDKEKSLQHYLNLQSQVLNREQLLGNLNNEIANTELRIDRTKTVLSALQSDIERLQMEYREMVRAALRNKMNRNSEAFLLSSESVNQFFKRFILLKQYESYRRRQVSSIFATQATLKNKTNQLSATLAEKETILRSIKGQKEQLGAELKVKNNLLVSLKENEKMLATSLEDQLRQRLKLDQSIERVIRSEMEALSKRNAAAPKSAKKTMPLKNLSDFQQAKGNLPWPVEDGQIIRSFGTQQHPDFKDVQTVNNGIDILATPKAPVKVVFPGKVVGTQVVPGFQYTVIVQHDNFYTVYANMEHILVKRGDIVGVNQSIGSLGDEKPEIHFELWKEKQRLNPSDWIQ